MNILRSSQSSTVTTNPLKKKMSLPHALVPTEGDLAEGVSLKSAHAPSVFVVLSMADEDAISHYRLSSWRAGSMTHPLSATRSQRLLLDSVREDLDGCWSMKCLGPRIAEVDPA
jgi:hypothetical protein